MKHLPLVACALLICPAAIAAEPSRESVERLLAASHSEVLVATMRQRYESLITTRMDQMMREKNAKMNPEAQRASEVIKAKMKETLDQLLAWENVKDVFVQVYGESFTQAEVDALTAFYETPSGKAVVEKLPAAMEKSAALMQQRAAPVLQKLQQSFAEMRTASLDRAMMNNARQLRAASDQYFLENGVTVVQVAELVGVTKFIKTLAIVAGETYPTSIEKGKPIVVRKADGSEITLDR